MVLLEDKRNEFVRRAAMHSSRRSLGTATSDRDGSTSSRSLLRKRVSYPLSSKQLGVSNTMSSTLPARKPFSRRSAIGLSSSSNAADLLRLRKSQAASVSVKSPGECDRTENTEPNCSPVDHVLDSNQLEHNPTQARPMKESTSDDAGLTSTIEESSTIAPCSPLHDISLKGPIVVDSNATAVEQTTFESTALDYSKPLSPMRTITATEGDLSTHSAKEHSSAVRIVSPVRDGSCLVDAINDQDSEPGVPQDLGRSPVINHLQQLPVLSVEGSEFDSPNILSAVADKQSASDTASPSSMATSSSAGSESLNRIVQIFRNSVVKKQESRPSSTPQSPSSLSSNRSICSPIDEQRIQGRLVEDEWKRRARVAEDALAKLRLELHQAESTYEQVLKKCASETKEAVCKLNKSLEDEQEKVVATSVELGVMHAELHKARQETNRIRISSRFVNLVLVFFIAVIIYDSLRRPSLFYS